MKNEIIEILFKSYPSFQDNNSYPFDTLIKYLPKYQKNDLWIQILAMQDDKLLKIDDGLRQNIILFPKFYE